MGIKRRRELLNFHRNNTLFCNSIECYQICKGIWALDPPGLKKNEVEKKMFYRNNTLFCNSFEYYQICKGIWALDPPGLKKKEVEKRMFHSNNTLFFYSFEYYQIWALDPCRRTERLTEFL
jgi:hypothetical protein